VAAFAALLAIPDVSTDRKLRQEDLIRYGFSLAHRQMIGSMPEHANRVKKICDAFGVTPGQLVAGLAIIFASV